MEAIQSMKGNAGNESCIHMTVMGIGRVPEAKKSDTHQPAKHQSKQKSGQFYRIFAAIN